MKLQVKEGDLSTETLEGILDIFVRVKTTGTSLRIETKLVTALIRELIHIRKETCPMCEFSVAEGLAGLPSSQKSTALSLKPKIEVPEFLLSDSILEKSSAETKPKAEEINPPEPIIEEVAKPKKPLLLRGKLALRPKEKTPLRFWVILGLVLFNISWISALLIFLF